MQDLRLDGDVERGGRLVGDQQRRPADQRHGDHGALAQAARQFEGIGAQRALGIGEAHQPQHLAWLALAVALARSRSDVAAMQLHAAASPIWSPTVWSGDSEVIGSWKMIEMRAAADRAHLRPVAAELGDVDRRPPCRADR